MLMLGATVCSGDSGGGIVFKYNDKGVWRWYLRGVVSVAPMDETHTTCRRNSYTVFTAVMAHADFIKPIIEAYS